MVIERRPVLVCFESLIQTNCFHVIRQLCHEITSLSVPTAPSHIDLLGLARDGYLIQFELLTLLNPT